MGSWRSNVRLPCTSLWTRTIATMLLAESVGYAAMHLDEGGGGGGGRGRRERAKGSTHAA